MYFVDVIKLIVNSSDMDRKFINQINSEGNTALHWACLNGHFECAKFLIESGADFTVHVV